MVREINQRGLDLIKKYEGLRLKAYYDLKGVLTIGYGHTGNDVVEGMKINLKKADELLVQDTKSAAECVTAFVEIYLTDNQYSAVCCLVYNIGCMAFRKSRTLKALNAGNYSLAKQEWMGWNKITKNGEKIAVQGLTNRRIAEIALFSEDFNESNLKKKLKADVETLSKGEPSTNFTTIEDVETAVNTVLDKADNALSTFERLYKFIARHWIKLVPISGLVNVEVVSIYLKNQPIWFLIIIYSVLAITVIGLPLYSLIKYFKSKKRK